MSLRCIDMGVEKKLKEVYPNVLFGPLARALEESAEETVKYEAGGAVHTSDSEDYEIIHHTPANPIATSGTAPNDFGTERTSKNQVVAFPLIAFDRISNDYDFATYQANDPLIRRGMRSGYLERERAFPVAPIYQIDIISNRRYEVDELWRELSMYLYLSPNIEVVYSPGTEYEETQLYPLILSHTDNVTDVETFTDKGVIYRQTITAQLHDAKLLFRKDIKLIEEIPIHTEPFNEDWIVKEDKR